MNDGYDIEVTIRGEIENGYRLKVSFLNIGMFIDGFRALRVPEEKNPSGWWIQQPSYRVGRNYKKSPEFNMKHPFWLAIEKACVDAASHEAASSLEDLSQEEISKGLDDAYDRVSNQHKYAH